MIILISILLTSALAQSAMMTKSFKYEIYGNTESEVLERAKTIFPKIKSGEIKSIWQTDCRMQKPSNVSINSLIIKKFYNVISDNELKTRYLGIINYKVKRCKD